MDKNELDQTVGKAREAKLKREAVNVVCINVKRGDAWHVGLYHFENWKTPYSYIEAAPTAEPPTHGLVDIGKHLLKAYEYQHPEKRLTVDWSASLEINRNGGLHREAKE